MKDRICKWKCRANFCGKKRHTLLHQDNTQQQASINTSFSQKIQKVDSTTFVQVIPVKVSNDSKTSEVNALANSCFDATLTTSKSAHQLNGEMKPLNILDYVSKSATKFRKWSCHLLYSCVCNSRVAVSIIYFFDLRK